MPDELLPYYEKELSFIRQMGARFSDEHPKIAGRLGINTDTVDDPHVSRLIESFAYLNARIQHKLDDDFPELSEALLDVMFPHYLRPIPAMSIVRFYPDPEQLENIYTVSKSTVLETETFNGTTCKFTTAYDADLYPLSVEHASLMGSPFNTPGSSSVKGANSVLKLSLKTFTDDIDFSNINKGHLRFYLKGQTQHINPLYELLLNNCMQIVIASSEIDSEPVYCGKHCIKPVGFDENQGLLPYPSSSFIGYRLLTEYFIFPEKFMFIDINEVLSKISKTSSTTLDIYIYLSDSNIELEHNINKDTFVLGCTPVINLFDQIPEPIKMDNTRTEYQIVPDSRKPNSYEVYSIDQVSSIDKSGKKQSYLPMYGCNHNQISSSETRYWHYSRRHASLDGYLRDEATDVFLSLVDIGFDPHTAKNTTISVRTTCSNRNQPGKLPFSDTQPKLNAIDASPPCVLIKCITQPTSTIRPDLRNLARWRLISHLNLNYLTLARENTNCENVKELLRLYNFKGSSATKGIIESISSISTHSISAPLTIDGKPIVCRGTEIEIELDDQLLTGSSRFLFASILENFFALYCSINSFTRLLVKIKGKEGYLKKCPIRIGEKVTL